MKKIFCFVVWDLGDFGGVINFVFIYTLGKNVYFVLIRWRLFVVWFWWHFCGVLKSD